MSDSVDSGTVYENFPVVEKLKLNYRKNKFKPVMIEINEKLQNSKEIPQSVKSMVIIQQKSVTKQVEELLLTKPDLMRYSQKVVSLLKKQH